MPELDIYLGTEDDEFILNKIESLKVAEDLKS